MTSNRLLIFLTAVALAALVGLPARAQTQPDIAVYANNGDNTWEGQKTFRTSTPQVLEIYIDKLGTDSSGTPCNEQLGVGDQLCGYDLLIEVEGDPSASISDFDPASALKTAVYPVMPATTRQLRVNFVDVAPPNASPIHVGTLTVDATGFTAAKVWAKGENVVTANLGLVDIDDQIIALPEPGGMLLLVSGILGLAALSRLPRRR
jgi:hypothetical protein